MKKPMNSGLEQEAEDGLQGGREGTEVGEADMLTSPSLPPTKSCHQDTFPSDTGNNKCLVQKSSAPFHTEKDQ